MQESDGTNSGRQRVMAMVGLIIAGEAIFALPFHVARFFRPTVLRVFDFTNTELGLIQATYGVVAMLAYFPGGPLADRFPARRLMTLSLVSTGLGGLYFASFPGYDGMKILFGFWGLTSILLFWAALIRATREWGGSSEQGFAYGILDGGRGLLAAAIATAAVVLFGFFFPDDPSTVTDAQRLVALRNVIYVYTGITLGAAVFVWVFVAEPTTTHSRARQRAAVWRNIPKVFRLPAVWLQALIVVCAYVAYKGIDNYSLFAVQGFGMNEVDAAKVSAVSAWVRPFAAVAAGFLGDRVTSSRVVSLCFGLLAVSYLAFVLVDPGPGITWLLFVNIIVTCTMIFGLRGVYFALFEEASVPTALTGTAVGLVSVIGYTPDIFVAPLAGWLLDRSPGVAGHQHYFVFLSAVAGIGLVTSLVFRQVSSPRIDR